MRALQVMTIGQGLHLFELVVELFSAADDDVQYGGGKHMMMSSPVLHSWELALDLAVSSSFLFFNI